MRKKSRIYTLSTLLAMTWLFIGWGVLPAQAASLSPEKNSYNLGERIKVTFSYSASDSVKSQAWIGIMPSSTPRYDEQKADDADTSYFYVKDYPAGVGELNAPDKVGSYDIRFWSDDPGGTELGCVTITVGYVATTGTLSLDKTSYSSSEKIKVAFSPATGLNSQAWIGVMPSSTVHNDEQKADDADTSYFYVKDCPSGVGELLAPQEAGSYDVRFWSDDPGGNELASVGFTVGRIVNPTITDPPHITIDTPVVTQSPADVNVLINGKPLVSDVKPMINEDGRTMLPVSAIATALGAQVQWDGASQTATLTRGTIIVKITIGQNEINVNGSQVPMDTTAVIKDGRTLLPVGAVGTALGAGISWDAGTRTIIIIEG